MDITGWQPRPSLQDDSTCALIDLVANGLLRDIEKAGLLADEMGRSQLAEELRHRAREISELLKMIQPDRQCGSECWLG